ncbi:mycofactocin precursor [Nocardioides agariphilus]|jgi:mycofactocin precursor|uniref:Mycofactocin n=1 Tax=Nocardioides agariphilus TaxID=433664 RepID=A0A930YF84_9ACTN|nr:mycofactocin precursor MftA [Nocardioides agariphilus]MBF4766226.1 mycofactocin precursor [Nocardioides agariphilus]
MSHVKAPAPAPVDTEYEGQGHIDQTSETDLVAEDLIEEISIDGMCGVY